jgi:hypothetical protein
MSETTDAGIPDDNDNDNEADAGAPEGGNGDTGK